MGEAIKVGVLGDIYPSGPCESHLMSLCSGNIFGQIPDYLATLDYVVGNLESPLTAGGVPIIKGGPNLRADPAVIAGIKRLGVDALGLANNHIMDYGEVGLFDTINTCQGHGLSVFGAGQNLAQAKSPHVIAVKNKNIAFVGFAEREYSIADDESAGAAPFDVYTSLSEIEKLRREVDVLIVLYHGGIEHYKYPSPNLQRLCRSLVDAGADFVTCQHSHCIGASEVYCGRPVLYGQGNFLFNYGEGRDLNWRSGLIAELIIDNDVRANYLPVTAVGCGVDMASPAQAIALLNEFEQRSKEILDPCSVQNAWRDLCANRESGYIDLVLGLNRYARFINRVTKGALVRCLYNDKDMRNILNVVRCESHRDILVSVLEKRVGSRSDG